MDSTIPAQVNDGRIEAPLNTQPPQPEVRATNGTGQPQSRTYTEAEYNDIYGRLNAQILKNKELNDTIEASKFHEYNDFSAFYDTDYEPNDTQKRIKSALEPYSADEALMRSLNAAEIPLEKAAKLFYYYDTLYEEQQKQLEKDCDKELGANNLSRQAIRQSAEAYVKDRKSQGKWTDLQGDMLLSQCNTFDAKKLMQINDMISSSSSIVGGVSENPRPRMQDLLNEKGKLELQLQFDSKNPVLIDQLNKCNESINNYYKE